MIGGLGPVERLQRERSSKRHRRHFAFFLSMPGSPSWNGRWSGEGSVHAIIRTATSAKAVKRFEEIATKAPYYHHWSDGWCACIDVREVEGQELRRIRKNNAGFSGYDWMVSNIERYGSAKGKPNA